MNTINLIKIKLVLVLIFVSVLQIGLAQISPSVFKPPPFFRARKFYIIQITKLVSLQFPSQSYSYKAPQVLKNIQNCKLILTDFDKQGDDEMNFDTQMVHSGPNTDTFTITINSYTSNTTTFSFTIIVIMSQTQPFIDIHKNCKPILNFRSRFNELFKYILFNSNSVTNTFQLSSSTIFQNTIGLKIAAFLVSIKSTVNPMGALFYPNKIQITALFPNTTHAKFKFTSGSQTKVTQVCMVAVIYNSALIDTKMSNGQPYGYFDTGSLQLTGPYTFSTSSFGPSFNDKCVLGINTISYFKSDSVKIIQIMSPFNHFIGEIFQNPGFTKSIYFQMVCVGYDYQCSNAYFFYDIYLNECFAQADCPVAPSGNYTVTDLCGLCKDPSCSSCDIHNRSLCLSCYNDTKKILYEDYCVCMNEYADSTNGSQICDVNCTYYLSGCKVYGCDNVLNCKECQVNFYISGGTCISCTSIQNCTACENTIGMCTQCQTEYFVSAGACQPCSTILNCIACQNTTGLCTQCQIDYFVNVGVCLPCSSISNCTKCQNATGMCTQCQLSFYVSGGICESCSLISNCIKCQNISNLACIQCQSNYYLNAYGISCLLCSLSILNCQICSNDSFCDLCYTPFINDQNNTCNNCSVGTYVTQICINSANCINAQMINGVATCIGCDISLNFQLNWLTHQCQCMTGFKLNNAKNACLQVCGDGIVIYMPCDDGNLISGDGCSSTCQIQLGYVCIITPSKQSHCVFHQNFFIALNCISRVFGQNSALLPFTISPVSTKLQMVDWKSAVTFNFSNVSRISYEYSNGQLLVKAQCTSTINGNYIQMKVNFNPNQIVSNPSQLQFSMFACNGQLNYQTNLSDYENLTSLSQMIVVLTLLQFIIGSYFHKMIGLQTLQCIQSLQTQKSINQLTNKLKQLLFDFKFFASDKSQFNQQLLNQNQQCYYQVSQPQIDDFFLIKGSREREAYKIYKLENFLVLKKLFLLVF